MGTRSLGDLTEGRYHLLITSEEADQVQQQGVVVLVLFMRYRNPMASTALHHIGIATQNPGALEKLFALLDLHVKHREEVADQKVMTTFLPVGGPTHLELLESTDPEGVIARHLAKRGPGIHHLSFLLPQGKLEAVSQKLLSEGYRLLYDRPRNGAQHMRVNFIHPASAGGILVEIMESHAHST